LAASYLCLAEEAGYIASSLWFFGKRVCILVNM
jgi:hypothetical protein